MRRRVGETEMNRNSSRSHSVFSVTLTSTTKANDQKKKRTLHLVDLAGSERQKSTEAKGERLKEASAINKSLSALGNVIKSLVDVASEEESRDAVSRFQVDVVVKRRVGWKCKMCCDCVRVTRTD